MQRRTTKNKVSYFENPQNVVHFREKWVKWQKL